jgi:hypothetical protein
MKIDERGKQKLFVVHDRETKYIRKGGSALVENKYFFTRNYSTLRRCVPLSNYFRDRRRERFLPPRSG